MLQNGTESSKRILYHVTARAMTRSKLSLNLSCRAMSSALPLSTDIEAKEFTDITDKDDIIKFFVPENLQYAIFNGASILGSLPSFQGFFVTYEDFQADPNVLYRDISDVFR